MGLFDSVDQQTRTTARTEMLSLAEGVAAIALYVVASDGHVATQESKLLLSALEGMQCFHSYSGDVINRMFNKLGLLIQKYRADEYLGLAVNSIPQHMGPTVFAVAADLAYSDGHIAKNEKIVLEMLYKLLDIPEETATAIIRVMQIRHQY